jgi:hypothetical protein
VIALGLLAVLGAAFGQGSSEPTTVRTAVSKPLPRETSAGQPPATAAILDLATGRPVAFVSTDQPITGVTSDRRGGWYIGGGFTTVNGMARPHLAHITSDGTLDATWQPALKARAGALAFLSLAVAGRDVVVSGGFREVSGRPRHGLAAFGRDGGMLDTGWVAPTDCFDGSWHITSVGARTYASTGCGAGVCVQALDVRGRDLAGWDASLTPVGEMPCVDSLAAGGAALYLTGGFTQIRGRDRPGIGAVALTDGSVLDGFRPRGPCLGPAHAVAVGRRLVFTGGDACPIAALERSSGAPVWHLARRDNASTAALATAGSVVFVGGEFGRLGGVRANGFAAFDQATGRMLPTWHPSTGGTIVYSLSMSGGRLLIAGSNL